MKKSKNIIIVLICIIICGFGLRGKISGEKFDSERWKTADLNSENNWSLRWDMINSLRNNYDLIGMTKDKIIELLGKSESQSQTELSYYLGMAKKGIDTGTLIIKFNEIGKVTHYNVRNG